MGGPSEPLGAPALQQPCDPLRTRRTTRRVKSVQFFMVQTILAVAVLLAPSPQEPSPEQIRQWISALDSENAKVREEAEARLLRAGRPIRPLLSAALSGLSPEQKGRVES